MQLRNGKATGPLKRPAEGPVASTFASKAPKLKPPSWKAHMEKAAQEEIHLRSIFPPELWLLILDNIAIKETHGGVNMLEIISNSCQYFRTLLRPKQVHFLFPDVVAIVKKQRRDNAEGLDILKCRQACTSWNKAITQYYVNHPSRLNLLPGATFPCDDLPTVEFSDAVNIAHFMDFVEAEFPSNLSDGITGNPFISRFLKIRFFEIPDIPDLEDFWESFVREISLALDRFGKQVHFCKIELARTIGDHPTLPVFYSALAHWMGAMENLKTLEIGYNRVTYLLPEIEAREERIFEEIRGEHSFPRLKQLQCLKMCHLPSVVFNELFQANAHVRNVHVVGPHENYATFPSNVKAACQRV